jgi:hypothetical protein
MNHEPSRKNPKPMKKKPTNKKRKGLPPVVAKTQDKHELDDILSCVREFAPDLVDVRATLIPFDDVICSTYSGPQPESSDYDPEEEQHFVIEVLCPTHSECSYRFKVTQHDVEMTYWMSDGNEGEEMIDPPTSVTLAELWNFLRQLPRGAYSFIK